MAPSAFGWRRRRHTSPRRCYLHRLYTTKLTQIQGSDDGQTWGIEQFRQWRNPGGASLALVCRQDWWCSDRCRAEWPPSTQTSVSATNRNYYPRCYSIRNRLLLLYLSRHTPLENRVPGTSTGQMPSQIPKQQHKIRMTMTMSKLAPFYRWLRRLC